MICHCPRHSHWFLTCVETIRLPGTYFTSMNFLKTSTTLGNKLLSFDKLSILKKFSKKNAQKEPKFNISFYHLSSLLDTANICFIKGWVGTGTLTRPWAQLYLVTYTPNTIYYLILSVNSESESIQFKPKHALSWFLGPTLPPGCPILFTQIRTGVGYRMKSG